MNNQLVIQVAPESNCEHIEICKPYNFNLIPQLALQSREYHFPYLYLENSWSCLIPVEENEIPVRIMIMKEGGKLFLEAKMYGKISSNERQQVLQTVRRSFNTELDLHKFYSYARNDEKLYNVISKIRGLKPFFSVDPYHSLIRTVLRQLVSAKAASQFITNLVNIFGRRYYNDGVNFYGMPSPERLSKLSKQELISCKLGFKWKLVKTLAEDIVTGDLDLKELEKKSDEYVMERLQEYSGIGDWTARTFLYDGFARLDSYQKYDMTLVKTISELYYHGQKITASEVDQFFEKYSRFHGIVVPYLFGNIWLQHQKGIN